MSGPTPGHWHINPFCAQVDSSERGEDGALLPICRMLWPTNERDEATTMANARLAAAAPDLLEAGKGLLAFHDAADSESLDRAEAYDQVIAAMRAAIAKATKL